MHLGNGLKARCTLKCRRLARCGRSATPAVEALRTVRTRAAAVGLGIALPAIDAALAAADKAS